MKRYSALLAIREMQIETIMYIGTHLSEWLQWKKVITSNAGEDVEKLGCPCIAMEI